MVGVVLYLAMNLAMFALLERVEEDEEDEEDEGDEEGDYIGRTLEEYRCYHWNYSYVMGYGCWICGAVPTDGVLSPVLEWDQIGW